MPGQHLNWTYYPVTQTRRNVENETCICTLVFIKNHSCFAQAQNQDA